MKALNLLRILPCIALFAILVLLPNLLHAQCRTDVNYGQNVVINGDFENGYNSWAFTPQTIPWSGDPPATQADGYRVHGSPSLPGDIFVGNNPNTQFNGGFQTFPDHTTLATTKTGKYLMVDGVCKLGVKLYSETVTVADHTNYYFSVWINSLKDNPTNPGVLNFDVGGVNIGANIIAPSLGGASAFAGGDTLYGWKKYEVVWNSGTLNGTVAISIENQNTTSCSNQVDFAIDDISFIPGCSYGSPGPQPNLGPDRTLCGAGGSITLNANVPMKSTTTVSWSDGTSNTGSNPAFYSKVITTPGTYSVCVDDNGSCIKSDAIVITNTFTPATTPGANLCSTTSVPLDAVFTGIGVTYQWKVGGVNLPNPSTNRTYTATAAGNYTVAVTAPGCGTVTSGITAITTSSTITPVDAYYCATSGPVSGLTLGATIASPKGPNLKWYTVATKGTAIATGVTSTSTSSTYTVPTIPMGTTATQTYYVEDNTSITGVAGATTYSTSGLNYGASATQPFNIIGEVTVNSLQIPFITNYSPAGGSPAFTVTLEVVKSNGTSFVPAKIFTSSPSLQTIPGNDGGNIRLYTFPFTTFTITDTTASLRLKLNSHTHPNGAPQINQSGFTYPIVSSPTNAITITGSNTDNATTPATDADGYSFFYNWQITSKFICSRVPVRAISNCPTPVTWTSFYLVPKDDNSCKLVWSTADETDNSYFAIERSVDGINFETFATVTGAGNRDIASNYYYIDNAPLSGTSYYRITQYDYDGKFSSTTMKAYSSLGLIQVTTYPNPFQNNTTLLVSGADAQTYTYTLYSVNGQLVEQGSGTINQTQTIGEAVAKGMYMLTVVTTTDIVTTKIVKQ